MQKGIFAIKHKEITRENCLIYKPFCEICKINKKWVIAKEVKKIDKTYYSLCHKCNEDITKWN